MAWKLGGKLNGRSVTMEYLTANEQRDRRVFDRLLGDPELVNLVELDIAAGRRVAQTATATSVLVTLDDPLSVFLAACSHLSRLTEVSGITVEHDPLPDGAVA